MIPPSGNAGEDNDIIDGTTGACAKANEILNKNRDEVKIFFILLKFLNQN
jgi:hypothetical protein